MASPTCIFPTCNRKAETNNYCFLHKIYSDAPAPSTLKKQIPKVSEKRALIDKAYKKIKAEKNKKDPRCKVKSPVCTGKAQGQNHTQKRSPANLINPCNLVSCCNACNNYIESHTDWAKANGHLVSRFAKI